MEILAAGEDLLWRGEIFWGDAFDSGRNVAAVEYEPIIPVVGVGLVGKAAAVKATSKKSAREIARERATGAIPSLSSGSKAEQDKPRSGIAEARHRFAPVRVGIKPLFHGCSLAEVDKPWTESTGDHFLVDNL